MVLIPGPLEGCLCRQIQLCTLSWEDPLEKGKATNSSILAWRIPWTKSMGSQSRIWLSDFHSLYNTCCCCCYVASVVSDSVRPQRRQPTRLPRPWDSPGKNTGVGCHFLLQCMKVKSESEVAQLCPTLVTPWTVAHQASSSMGFSRQEYWSGVPLPSPSVSLESPNTRTKIGLSVTVILCYYPMQQEKMRKKTIS